MPELFRLFGLRFFFWSREHEPIHVHVQNADGEAKFDILPEGIVLKDVPDGKYFLSSAPLNISGADGAPCRSILIDF